MHGFASTIIYVHGMYTVYTRYVHESVHESVHGPYTVCTGYVHAVRCEWHTVLCALSLSVNAAALHI